MSLYENLIALVNKYFYKTEEKPAKYNEWLTSEYVNGAWYICEEVPEMPLIFTFAGTELTQYSSGSFSGTDMYIDYGDGTIETTTGKFGHTYAENGIYVVKIYGVTSLGTSCFRGCTGLTSIVIPDSVTSIGSWCFYNCTGLTSIILSNNINKIEDYCFNTCTGLTSITLPININSIKGYCFTRCTNLTSIILKWTSTNDIVTYNSAWTNSTSPEFIIPQGTIQLYIDKGYPSNKLVDKSLIYYNDGSNTELYNPQSAIITTENGMLKITTDTSGEKKVSIPYEFEENDNVFMELTWCGGSVQPIALMFTRGGTNHFGWVSYWIDGTYFDDALDSVINNVAGTIETGDIFRLERNNGVSKFYQNGNLLFQSTVTFTEKFRFGFYTNNGRVQLWKNIQIGYITE